MIFVGSSSKAIGTSTVPGEYILLEFPIGNEVGWCRILSPSSFLRHSEITFWPAPVSPNAGSLRLFIKMLMPLRCTINSGRDEKSLLFSKSSRMDFYLSWDPLICWTILSRRPTPAPDMTIQDGFPCSIDVLFSMCVEPCPRSWVHSEF